MHVSKGNHALVMFALFILLHTPATEETSTFLNWPPEQWELLQENGKLK